MSKFEALQHIDPRTFLEDCLKYTGALPLDDWNQIAILNTINQTIFFEHGNVETVQRYLHKYDFDYLVNEILNYDPVKYCSLLIRCQRFAEFTLSLNKIDLNNFLLIKLWLIAFCAYEGYQFLELIVNKSKISCRTDLEDGLILNPDATEIIFIMNQLKIIFHQKLQNMLFSNYSRRIFFHRFNVLDMQ